MEHQGSSVFVAYWWSPLVKEVTLSWTLLTESHFFKNASHFLPLALPLFVSVLAKVDADSPFLLLASWRRRCAQSSKEGPSRIKSSITMGIAHICLFPLFYFRQLQNCFVRKSENFPNATKQQKKLICLASQKKLSLGTLFLCSSNFR